MILIFILLLALGIGSVIVLSTEIRKKPEFALSSQAPSMPYFPILESCIRWDLKTEEELIKIACDGDASVYKRNAASTELKMREEYRRAGFISEDLNYSSATKNKK